MTPAKKIRIDQLLVQLGLAPSRHRAQAMVMAGIVVVDEHRVEKCSQSYLPDAQVRIRGQDHPYVGRGGLKLAGALDAFKIDPRGMVALDVGASTGGFTDCLLQRGALRVHAWDTGQNQLHERLRRDPRVVSREKFNVRFLKPEDVPEAVRLVVVDVSFISLKLILPALIGALPGKWEGLLLIKPQFEAAPSEVGKGGVIRDEAVRARIVAELTAFATGLGLAVDTPIPAVISGEYLETKNIFYTLAVKVLAIWKPRYYNGLGECIPR